MVRRDSLAGIDGRTASILCYIPWVGWIMSIIVLASDRYRRDRAVRFHGFQALYLFVAWLMEDQVLWPMLRHGNLHSLHAVLQAVLLGAAVFMMIKDAGALGWEGLSIFFVLHVGSTIMCWLVCNALLWPFRRQSDYQVPA